MQIFWQVCLWFWCKDLLWKIGADTRESFANLPIICLILEVKFGEAPSNNLIQQVKFSKMYFFKKNLIEICTYFCSSASDATCKKHSPEGFPSLVKVKWIPSSPLSILTSEK